ncbi:hypothetical protein AB0J21_13580 [Streptomyces sp. NPDC049954]|uniref:hypothetical protein n=1 Tax=Streptomyces sp. NPDC049954 TaxID=3155779 RepID=UPI00342D5E01
MANTETTGAGTGTGTAGNIPAATAHRDHDTLKAQDAGTRRAFDAVRTCAGLYGVLCALVLVTLAVLVCGGHPVSLFMWVRGAVLLALAPVIRRPAARAAQGVRRGYERVRTLTAVMPVAIVGVDLIPGVCPAWYAATQAVCALPLVVAAFLVRGRGPRAAFPGRG